MSSDSPRRGSLRSPATTLIFLLSRMKWYWAGVRASRYWLNRWLQYQKRRQWSSNFSSAISTGIDALSALTCRTYSSPPLTSNVNWRHSVSYRSLVTRARPKKPVAPVMKRYFSRKYSALDVAILNPEPVDSHSTRGSLQRYIVEAMGDP